MTFEAEAVLIDIGNFLVVINATANFFVYMGSSEEFRTSFYDRIKRLWKPKSTRLPLLHDHRLRLFSRNPIASSLWLLFSYLLNRSRWFFSFHYPTPNSQCRCWFCSNSVVVVLWKMLSSCLPCTVSHVYVFVFGFLCVLKWKLKLIMNLFVRMNWNQWIIYTILNFPLKLELFSSFRYKTCFPA